MNRSSLALLTRRGFGLLWWGGLISLMGNRMLQVALPITVLSLTGSPTAMTAIVAMAVLPQLLLGPLVGVLVDRWDRRRVMVWSNVAMAASLLPLLLVNRAADLWICAAVTLVNAAIAPFASTAENALLPGVVADAELPAANSLNSLNNNLARLIGPMVGGVATLWLGLRGVVVLDVVTFLAAAAMVYFVGGAHRAVQEAAEGGAVKRFFGEFTDGLKVTVRSRVLVVLSVVLILGSIGEGVMSSLFTVWVTDVLGGGAPELGWLISAQAVGGILGGLVGGWFGARWSPRVLIGVGMLLFGLIDTAIFTYPLLPGSLAHGPIPGIVGMIAVGVPGVVASAAMMTLFQRATDDTHRGRVFAFVGALMSAATLLGTGLVFWLTGPLPVIVVLSIQGVTGVLVGLGALTLLPRAQAVRAEAAHSYA
ncbi:MFS transporter [Actinorhabdospora filicis]|uniref:MFS transporter n=1 Tax=Actinorhabdospora filicis TaxID=1785913 RepID=A0A9W6SH45_9ACTN|nr:MFS transporter [Actinorhabdospora filicis]GLZ75898.1 MFS transporter [Actinorhabdospora filicis]